MEENISFEKERQIVTNIIDGNIDSLLLNIKEGWNINKPLLLDEEGYQYRHILPIMLAVYKCNVNSVRFLVEHKAKLDVGNEHAFLYGVRYANYEVLDYLIQNKTKVNMLSQVYTNAYSEAYMGHHYNYFKLINQQGLDVNVHARDAINLAVNDNNYEALKEFINLSVDLNNNVRTKNNYYGDTPLIYGVYQSNILMIHYLLSHGAAPDFPNLNGQTPYTIALKLQNEKIISLLKATKINSYKINDLEVFKMPDDMLQFLTNNSQIELPYNSTIPYIVFLPITEIREGIFNKKKRFIITSNVGEYPSIHLLWNPYKQCISYYEDEYMEYGDICSFKEFLLNPTIWLEGIFEKSYLENKKRTD